MKFYSVVGEGILDLAVGQRIVTQHGFQVHRVYPTGGKSHLDSKISGYNAAANYGLWLVLRDLNSAVCGPELVQQLLPMQSPGMRFRVAVRAIESWLLADAKGFAKFVGVSELQIPYDPDLLASPKDVVLQLAAASRSRTIKRELLPASGTSAKVGIGYNPRLISFVQNTWDVARARRRSQSLDGCCRAL